MSHAFVLHQLPTMQLSKHRHDRPGVGAECLHYFCSCPEKISMFVEAAQQGNLYCLPSVCLQVDKKLG